MRIKLSKQNWRLVGQKMGWLKKKAQWIVGLSKKEFLDKTLAEKKVIAKEQPVSSETQPLFFTQKYEGKGTVLRALAGNDFCNEKTEKMFSTQEYEGKSGTLEVLRKRLEKKKLKKKASYESFEREYDNIKITYKGINFICSFKISGELDEGFFPNEPNFSDEDYVLAPMTKDNDPFGYKDALTDPNADAEDADQRSEKWFKDNPDYVEKISHLIWDKMGSEITDGVEGDYRADWTDKDYRRQHDNFYGGER